MKKVLYILAILLPLLSSCEHKDLCYNHREHAHKYHIRIVADYRYDWEECYGGIDWSTSWPSDYVPYDELRPTKPSGLRVVNYGVESGSDNHNIGADGGVVNLFEGPNNILLYNNDTEYIVFSRHQEGNSATTRATTRVRSRSTYKASEFANKGEETITPPDMLFANYIEGYEPEKSVDPVVENVVLQPLVYTYYIHYKFTSGLKYVAIARGALTGMAASVTMNTGDTSDVAATLIYDCTVTDKGVEAQVRSFGAPSFPHDHYPSRGEEAKHALNLEVMLRNGKMLNFDFDVTDQVKKQPHGGVIVVDGIEVSSEDGSQGSGSFDVDVNGWGDYQDIPLDILPSL
ncbi:MAG: DUF5119 domain-containing protein [Tidjanibacter sp.]|nr:DUF5119 domain-containing protein [Tidjanibacter sp.]